MMGESGKPAHPRAQVLRVAVLAAVMSCLAGCQQPADAAGAKAGAMAASAAPSEARPAGVADASAADPAVAALNASFDPARDPSADLRIAMAEARRSGRRIVLDVGGEWCVWCHRMDKFIAEDAQLSALRDASYVWMKVNYSEDNENAAFLAQYPEVKGYPHLFVLDADGKLLHSQFTGALEADKSYDRAKFLAFLEAWLPKTS